MAGSGPAPNPNSRRQTGNQAHTWLDLPANGYDGAIPKFPLPAVVDGFADRELELWESIWRTPQAAAWALNGWAHDVALYVRYFALGEAGSLDSAKEARMWSDRLGLNPAAMLKNRWRVRADEVGSKREQGGKSKPKRRLKVVDDAVAGS
jgi:hypothetical protein